MNNYNEYKNLYPNSHDFITASNYAVNNIKETNHEHNNLYDPYEGFIRGNMFKNLYDPYKNYNFQQLVPQNEKEYALMSLDQLQFAMHEASLVLDIYPNNIEMLQVYKQNRDAYNNALIDFQANYQSVNVNSDALDNIPFGWQHETWPWEGSGL